MRCRLCGMLEVDSSTKAKQRLFSPRAGPSMTPPSPRAMTYSSSLVLVRRFEERIFLALHVLFASRKVVGNCIEAPRLGCKSWPRGSQQDMCQSS